MTNYLSILKVEADKVSEFFYVDDFIGHLRNKNVLTDSEAYALAGFLSIEHNQLSILDINDENFSPLLEEVIQETRRST